LVKNAANRGRMRERGCLFVVCAKKLNIKKNISRFGKKNDRKLMCVRQQVGGG